MKKKILVISLIILSILLYLVAISAQTAIDTEKNNEVRLLIFHGQGCPHCAKLLDFLSDYQKENPNLIFEEYEIYFNDENRVLFDKIAKAYGAEIEGVPTVFINDKVFVGFSSDVQEELVGEIEYCKQNDCGDPLDKINNNNTDFKKITIPAVIAAALVDAINPCAFAVLIILLTTILASSNRRRALMAGLAFSLAIFISYYLMGLGLYSAIQATGLTHNFYIIVAILAIIVGLFNLKDYLWYGKWFIMEVPRRWRPRMKILLKGVTSIPGAFLIGFVISLFLLPCTSGPYIVILGLLANITTRSYATFLLLLYNIIFILPMMIITLAVYYGITTTEKAEEWRTRKLKTLHLIAGIIILVLGILMLVSVYFGWI